MVEELFYPILTSLAITALLTIPPIVAGFIIVRRKHESWKFRALGLTMIVLPGLYGLYFTLLLIVVGATIIGLGDSMGMDSMGMTDSIPPSPTATP